jgi:hypothetical protein
VTCLLALFVFRWNIDKTVERDILDAKYRSWYNHDIVLQLQELLRGTPYADKFQDYTNYNDFADTGKTFFTPVVRELELLQHSFDEKGTQQTGETADVDILDGDELEVQELSQGGVCSNVIQFETG